MQHCTANAKSDAAARRFQLYRKMSPQKIYYNRVYLLYCSTHTKISPVFSLAPPPSVAPAAPLTAQSLLTAALRLSAPPLSIRTRPAPDGKSSGMLNRQERCAADRSRDQQRASYAEELQSSAPCSAPWRYVPPFHGAPSPSRISALPLSSSPPKGFQHAKPMPWGTGMEHNPKA